MTVELTHSTPPSRPVVRSRTRRAAQASRPAAIADVVESVREGEMGLQEPRGRLAPAKPPTHHDVYSPLKVLVTPQHHLHHVRERGYVERPVRVERIIQQVRTLAGVEIVDVKEHPEEAITAVHDPDFVRYLRDVSVKLAEGQAKLDDANLKKGLKLLWVGRIGSVGLAAVPHGHGIGPELRPERVLLRQ